ncbi:MAG TPA: hypothetical protein [Caudoviricetes sp.]|nr:MAG TPA: hypothetical protein [Caudoviricetes sp.]
MVLLRVPLKKDSKQVQYSLFVEFLHLYLNLELLQMK